MPAISIQDLENAKTDVDHIATVATSLDATATDRLGHVKQTLAGAVGSIATVTDRGAWASGAAYLVKDLVTVAGVVYICVLGHTAGATFAGDSAKWRVYQGLLKSEFDAFVADLEDQADPLKGAEIVGVPPIPVAPSLTEVLTGTLRDVLSSVVNRVHFMFNLAVTPEQFGAKRDGVLTGNVSNGTDDTSAINAAADHCRANGKALCLTSGAGKGYYFTGTLDFTGIRVFGFGATSKLLASIGEFDCIKTNGNTVATDFYLHGGWDGVTAGQSGSGILTTRLAPGWSYDNTFERLTIQFAKKNLIRVEVGGYSRIRSVKGNASGSHGLYLFGESGAVATTTTLVDGFSTFSDCPNGYGIVLINCINVAIDGAICENTKGVYIGGNDNRSISINRLYQEGTTDCYLTSDGAGIGLSVTNGFGAGSKITELPNWYNVTFANNSSIIESSASGALNRGRVISGTSGEVVTSSSGSFTVTQITVPPGSYFISATMQTQNAGSLSISGASIFVTTDVSASGRNVNTNANYSSLSDSRDYAPSASGALRPTIYGHYSNSTNTDVTLYLRGQVTISSGACAYKGTLTAMKL